ncbi:MAG: hypothetical protein E7615_02700 [Ruminococcaceae bacterium]|nr:hypothetical protein [Oscillospiraceae bacterium]
MSNCEIENNNYVDPTEKKTPFLAVGIDIGTTTVSACAIDLDSKEQLEYYSVPHNSYVEKSDFSEQSVSVIMDIAEELLGRIYKEHSNIACIGITGQMHGILYVDSDGKAVSNLINWQDKRATLPTKDGMNIIQLIKKLTGEDIASGYGIATHFFNQLNGLIPADAVGLCSIMDYLAMHLCSLRKIITHTSVAASFGLFDVERSGFKLDKLSVLGIDKSFLPTVTPSNDIVGKWNGIPVCVAIGDNQASFLGSVKNNRDSVLVNIGTGSQISAVGRSSSLGEGLECRPFINGDGLICGSALCGGSSYALIERFFRDYAAFAGGVEESQYDTMNALAEKAYTSGEAPLSVNTSFCGTRTDPSRRGSIENIDLYNFTPSALVLGVIDGMCDELYELYRASGLKKSRIVASGGAVRRNGILKRVMEDKFGMPVSITSVKEEAATGAALFSANALGMIQYNDGFADYIKYEENE